MTVPPVDEQPTPYERALHALVALLVLRAAMVVGTAGPKGLASTTARYQAAVVEVLAVMFAIGTAQARTLAVVAAAGSLSRLRGTPVAPINVDPASSDVSHLRQALTTITRDLPTGDAEPWRPLSEALAAIDARHDAVAAAIATRNKQDAADAQALADRLDAEEADALALADAEDQAHLDRLAQQSLDEQRRALDDAEQHLADLVAEQDRQDALAAERDARRLASQERRDVAIEAEVQRAADAAQAAQDRAAEQARIDRLAREEAYRAAHEALDAALAAEPEVLGWVRKLGPNACPTCVAWWASGATGFTPVRPYSIRMKRHVGCDCVQRPITAQEELDVRGFTDQPEPVSARWKRAHDRQRDPNTDTPTGG